MTPIVKGAAGNLDRSMAVNGVLASFRMEGLEPDGKTANLLQEYASGSLSLEQFGSAIERHYSHAGRPQALITGTSSAESCPGPE